MSSKSIGKNIGNPPKKDTTAKKIRKKKTIFDDNDITEEEHITYENNNDEEINKIDKKPKKAVSKKKKKKTKRKISNDLNIQPFNIDDDEEPKDNEAMLIKKKSKSQIMDENNIYDDDVNESKNDSKIKKKKKKKTVKKKDQEEKINEEIEVKPKSKKKKKKKVEKYDEEENQEDESNIIEEEKPVAKPKKKVKKKDEIYEEENNQQKENSYNEEEEIPIKKKKKTKKSKDKEIKIKENDEEDLKDEEIKKDVDEDKIRDNNIGESGKSLQSSIFNETKKKLGKIFFTKKKKNKNNDYIETDVVGTESTLQKEKNVTAFLEKAKGIKYKGYEYKIKKEDYFERKGIIITTILNSEDAAIKRCEEISNQIKNGDKWIDPDFGEQENNARKNKESLYGDGGVPAGSPKDSNIKWYPLSEISDYAQFFSDGVESNDVIQGCLGDCWFISALSVIATKDYLLRGEFSEDILADKKIDEEENIMLSTGIYPPIFHSFRKKGIFCFKFFKNFKWRYVLVDSRLPCIRVYNNQTPSLLYGQCRARHEFWVPLIEKAYAKLHGSYRSLVSGFIDDGLVDLTGLTSKKMIIEKEKLTTEKKVNELWDILLKNSTLYFNDKKQRTGEGKLVSAKFYTRNKTMMGCSVDSKGNTVEMEVVLHNRHTGILAGHAYSILDVFEISKPRGKKPRKTSRLLRIRNPWGRKEWNGKWSDDSVETKQNKERIEKKLNEKYKDTNEKINLSQEDGTFLMCFSDFRQIFNKLFICKNFPPSFVGIRIFGQWTKDESGGLPINPKQEKTFYQNPQFYLQKNKDGLLSISLLQNDGRLVESTFPFPGTINKVCLLIFKATSKNKITNLNNLLDKTLIVSRRDSILELDLPKGSYIIIPSTYENGKTGFYCLEFHFEDELIKGETSGKNKVECFKNTYIEKMGGNSVNWEVMSEFISSKAKSTSTNKEQFIIQKFKEIMKDEDDYEYSNDNKKIGNFNRANANYDDEDLDYI